MSAFCAVPGFPPSESDYESFERSWITRDLVDKNGIRRVDDAGGRQLIGRKGRAGNFSGWYVPYYFPGDPNVRGYRLRRDEPDAASLALMQETIEREGGRAVGFATTAKARGYVKRSQNHSGELLAPLISLALYLASTSREIRCGTLTEPVRPQVKQTRQYGPRLFPPSAPRVWEVGFRIGDTIRAGIAAMERGQRAVDGSVVRTHSVPRPHLRKAHYHHYWTGPLKGDRKLIVKWLHPIMVAAGDNQEGPGIVPIVHRVTAPLPGEPPKVVYDRAPRDDPSPDPTNREAREGNLVVRFYDVEGVERPVDHGIRCAQRVEASYGGFLRQMRPRSKTEEREMFHESCDYLS